jgi:hypothetical protein
MRIIARLISLVILGVAIYFWITGSWPTAVLFFLFYGGVEFTLYAMGADALPKRDN